MVFRTLSAGMRPNSAGGAIQPAGRTERLLEDIRAFGRLRHVVRGRSEADVQERQLGIRLTKARQARLLPAAPESELGRVPHEVPRTSSRDARMPSRQRWVSARCGANLSVRCDGKKDHGHGKAEKALLVSGFA